MAIDSGVMRCVAVLVMSTTALFGQFSAGPASGVYTSLAGTSGAVEVLQLSGNPGCSNCTEYVALPFLVSYFGSQFYSLRIESNGSINLGQSNSISLCCEAFPLDNGLVSNYPLSTGVSGFPITGPRISVLQTGLDPSSGAGSVWQRTTPTSIIVSYEGVEFMGSTGGSVDAQVEIFSTGDIEIRYGASVAPTGTTPVEVASGLSFGGLNNVIYWESPMSVVPEFDAHGMTSGGVIPQNTGCLFTYLGASVAPPFQINSPEADLRIENITGTSYVPAVTPACLNQNSTVMLRTSTPGALFELAIANGPIVPSGYVTPGGQVMNLDLLNLEGWLGGGATPFFQPSTPWAAFNPRVANPSVFTAQMVLLDPGHPDGYLLSQASQLDVDVANGPGPQNPLSPSGPFVVDLTNRPNCGPLTLPFCGTSYTRLTITRNGTIRFGNQLQSPAPSAANAQSGPPFFGFWAGLFTNSSDILYDLDANGITVTIGQVPYANSPGLNTIVLYLDITGVCVIDVSGVVPATWSLYTPSSTDGMWLGLSPGGGATDPGITSFGPGLSGWSSIGSEMLYDAVDWTTMTIGGTSEIPSVAALTAPGAQGRIMFVPGPGGTYSWTAY